MQRGVARRGWLLVVAAFLVAGCPADPKAPKVRVDVHDPGDEVVGTPFTVRADVFLDGDLRDGLVDVYGTWRTSGPLTPVKLDSTHLGVTDSFPDSTSFTCMLEGAATINYDARSFRSSDTNQGDDSTSFTCRCHRRRRDRPGRRRRQSLGPGST